MRKEIEKSKGYRGFELAGRVKGWLDMKRIRRIRKALERNISRGGREVGLIR
jgi:hypothetical protein